MRANIESRWYFGWNIVAAAAMLTLLSTGMRLGIGPYFLPMAHDLGFSRALLGAIVAAGMLCFGLAMPLVGLLVARYGTRNVLLGGAATVAGSALWTVNAHDPLSFLLAFGVCFSFGLACTSPVALTPVIGRWFTRRRGMALFLLATGSMAGMALMTPLMQLAVVAFGWRSTLLGFAGLLAACTLPAALFVMRDVAPVNMDLLPEEAAATRARASLDGLSLRQALRTAPFWQVLFGMFCCGYSMNLLGTHGVPMLVDRGFEGFTASSAIGVVGFAAIGGSVLLGRVSDGMSRRNLLAFVYLLRGVGFFALVLATGRLELYAAAAVAGFVWAGSVALSSAILTDVYGVRLVGVLYGLTFCAHQVGAGLASWLGGWAYEHSGSHWLAFGTAGGLLVVAAIVSLQLPRLTAPVFAPQPAP